MEWLTELDRTDHETSYNLNQPRKIDNAKSKKSASSKETNNPSSRVCRNNRKQNVEKLDPKKSQSALVASEEIRSPSAKRIRQSSAALSHTQKPEKFSGEKNNASTSTMRQSEYKHERIRNNTHHSFESSKKERYDKKDSSQYHEAKHKKVQHDVPISTYTASPKTIPQTEESTNVTEDDLEDGEIRD
uniref:Uncharacterized protein n=1 Tax=Panagrolaimus sp. ES5 TaxID=591445 RepID=A0AC34F5F6_9BILA